LRVYGRRQAFGLPDLVDFLPQCGWVSSNLLRIGIEQ
jgi:hypothetical protein